MSNREFEVRKRRLSEEDDDLMDLLEKKFKDIKKKVWEERDIWHWNP